MNTKFLFIISLIGIFSFSQCKSLDYKLQKNVPFTISKAYYQDWMGGQEGVSGTLVKLYVSHTDGIQPDSLFFQGKIVPIYIKNLKSDTFWVANYNTSSRMLSTRDKGSLKSVQTDSIYFPFELAKDEAVLRYTDDKKVYFFKINGLIQKETIYYPAARPKNQ